MGRNYRLFSDTPNGAAASGQLYSYRLVETAKANDQKPYALLPCALERLPQASSVEAYEALLPWRCVPQVYRQRTAPSLTRWGLWSAYDLSGRQCRSG